MTWMSNNDTPGPAAYDIGKKYHKQLMRRGPRDIAAQAYAHARWSRASRGGLRSEHDPDIQSEFAYVNVSPTPNTFPGLRPHPDPFMDETSSSHCSL